MAKVGATVLFTGCDFTIDWDRIRRAAVNQTTEDWTDHVLACYWGALGFALNEFWWRDTNVEHLLATPLDLGESLGESWSDWVILRNKRLKTVTLHVSFLFSNVRLNLDDVHCQGVDCIARFLSAVYKLSEEKREESRLRNEMLLLLGEELRKFANHRQHALGLSRYAYVSLYDAKTEHLQREPTDGALVNYYRLLCLHPTGVDVTTALERLPSVRWQAAEFFVLYAQPGGLLSVSCPHPKDFWNANRGWFDPEPPNRGQSPTGQGLRGNMAGRRSYNQYDMLPEYPPLRHLALPCLDYAACFEETLRDAHEAVFGSIVTRLVNFVRRRRPFQIHLMAANLEGVRLPVARSLVGKLLTEQLQERTVAAATNMQGMRLTLRSLWIAIGGLIAAILGTIAAILALPAVQKLLG